MEKTPTFLTAFVLHDVNLLELPHREKSLRLPTFLAPPRACRQPISHQIMRKKMSRILVDEFDFLSSPPVIET